MQKESDIFRNSSRALLRRSAARTDPEPSRSRAHTHTFRGSSTVTALLLDARTLYQLYDKAPKQNFSHCTEHD